MVISLKKARRLLTYFSLLLVMGLVLPLAGCSSADEGGGGDANSDSGSADGSESEADADGAEDADDEVAREPVISVSSDTFPLTVTDFDGYETVLEERPEKVVFLSGTPLNIWYDVGGEAVGRSELTDNIRLLEEKEDEILAVPSVGMPYAISAESVAAMKPDLIVGTQGPHDDTIDRFRELGFNAILIKVRSFEDLEDTYSAFGALAGEPEHAAERFAQISADTQDVLDRVPDQDADIVILFVSASNLGVKLNNSIIGQMLEDLGVENVASDLAPDNPGSETTPLNIEAIVMAQPDQVLVTSMIGSNEEARTTLEEQIESNNGWNAIDAIAEGKISYMPQQYFLYNAGPYYADALEYLAATVYPDVYGEPVEP